jgi:hypothetical protein
MAHPQSLFCLSSRVPSKGALCPGSLHRAPIRGGPTSRAPLSHILKFPVDEPTPG